MAAIEVLGLRWSGFVGSAREDVAATDTTATDVAALVADYSGVLYRVAFSVLRSPTESEDAVQDCFLRVVQHKAELGAVREMRTWLIRIVWNLALDRKRRLVPEQMDAMLQAGLVAKGLPADEGIAEAKRMAEVFRAIDALRGKEREVLLLSAIEELSTSEIAGVIGRSESSVRSLLFRARGHLRERLARQERQGRQGPQDFRRTGGLG
jgi:RNA polymerase sigma-70 factor (ECF subfamily)